jgi:hypothetical protein
MIVLREIHTEAPSTAQTVEGRKSGRETRRIIGDIFIEGVLSFSAKGRSLLLRS